jgi:hypothetical protein
MPNSGESVADPETKKYLGLEGDLMQQRLAFLEGQHTDRTRREIERLYGVKRGILRCLGHIAHQISQGRTGRLGAGGRRFPLRHLHRFHGAPFDVHQIAHALLHAEGGLGLSRAGDDARQKRKRRGGGAEADHAAQGVAPIRRRKSIVHGHPLA